MVNKLKVFPLHYINGENQSPLMSVLITEVPKETVFTRKGIIRKLQIRYTSISQCFPQKKLMNSTYFLSTNNIL